MLKLEAKLSANEMRKMAISRVENELDFIVCHNRYSCPWFVAALLSLKTA
jgi:hypothetical protein